MQQRAYDRYPKEMIDHNSQHSTHEIKVKNFCILVTKLMLEYCSKLPIIDAFGNLTWIEPAFRDRRHPLSHSCPQKVTGNSFEFFKILRVSSSFFCWIIWKFVMLHWCLVTCMVFLKFSSLKWSITPLHFHFIDALIIRIVKNLFYSFTEMKATHNFLCQD